MALGDREKHISIKGVGRQLCHSCQPGIRIHVWGCFGYIVTSQPPSIYPVFGYGKPPPVLIEGFSSYHWAIVGAVIGFIFLFLALRSRKRLRWLHRSKSRRENEFSHAKGHFLRLLWRPTCHILAVWIIHWNLNTNICYFYLFTKISFRTPAESKVLWRVSLPPLTARISASDTDDVTAKRNAITKLASFSVHAYIENNIRWCL